MKTTSAVRKAAPSELVPIFMVDDVVVVVIIGWLECIVVADTIPGGQLTGLLTRKRAAAARWRTIAGVDDDAPVAATCLDFPIRGKVDQAVADDGW